MQLNGTWDLTEKLPDVFKKRKSYIYYTNENKDIIDLKAIVYTTGTNLSFSIKDENNNDSKKMKDILENLEENPKNEKLQEEYFEIYNQLFYPFRNIYIENSKGIKFSVTDSDTLHGKVERPENKKIINYRDVLDLTIYDCTPKMKLHFIYNDKEYNITLITQE